MACRTSIVVLLTSALLGACTARDSGDDEMSAGDEGTGEDADTGDDGGSGEAGDPDGGDAEGGDPNPGSASGSGDGGAPIACEGEPATCFRDEPGTCAHVVDELAPDCIGREWVCPEGFAFEWDLQCTPEGDVLCTEGEMCWVGGDCAGESYEPTCVSGAPVCDRGDAITCAWLCEPGDTPPDDCYDQGPGECADFAPPPNCTDGIWTCPNGFEFGGYGEACEWPG